MSVSRACLVLGLMAGLTISVSMAANATPVVVYSDLGAGNSYIGSCSCGWGVGNGWYGSVAVPFTPSSDVDLSQILIALTSVYGSNSGTVELLNDNAGAPGNTVLESWNVTGLPVWQSASTIQPSQTLMAAPDVALSAGTQYWIEAQTAGGFIWMPTTSDDFQVAGQFPVCSNGCSNEFDTQFAPAFEVIASSVPEPVTLSLFGAGLFGMCFVYRRRTSTRA